MDKKKVEAALKLIDQKTDEEIIEFASVDFNLLSKAMVSLIGAIGVKTGVPPEDFLPSLMGHEYDWAEANRLYRKRYGKMKPLAVSPTILIWRDDE